METVQVLMSTYNGEKYIDEQIESILRQKNVNVKIQRLIILLYTYEGEILSVTLREEQRLRVFQDFTSILNTL